MYTIIVYMPYCSIEEAWKETLIENKERVATIPLVTQSRSDMDHVSPSNKEDDQTVLVKDYSKYYQSSNDDKIQNILKENIMLKERVKQLENQPKTVKNKYLINLFIYIFTGVIILLLLDNLPQYNVHSFRNPYQ